MISFVLVTLMCDFKATLWEKTLDTLQDQRVEKENTHLYLTQFLSTKDHGHKDSGAWTSCWPCKKEIKQFMAMKVKGLC